MDIKQYVTDKAKKAKAASRALANISTEIKNNALFKMAVGLEKESARLMAENKKDLVEAEKKGLSRAMIDRLTLNADRIKAMADGLREVAALPDPVGEIMKMRRRPNGMEVGRMRVPIGLIGIIYESRPNVTADSAALCIKSGNAVLLRGGMLPMAYVYPPEMRATRDLLRRRCHRGQKRADLLAHLQNTTSTPSGWF